MYHYLIPFLISIPFIIYSIHDELLECCSRDYKKYKLSNQELDNLIDKLNPSNIVNELKREENLEKNYKKYL
jgi:hypothetical protein